MSKNTPPDASQLEQAAKLEDELVQAQAKLVKLAQEALAGTESLESLELKSRELGEFVNMFRKPTERTRDQLFAEFRSKHPPQANLHDSDFVGYVLFKVIDTAKNNLSDDINSETYGVNLAAEISSQLQNNEFKNAFPVDFKANFDKEFVTTDKKIMQ